MSLRFFYFVVFLGIVKVWFFFYFIEGFRFGGVCCVVRIGMFISKLCYYVWFFFDVRLFYLELFRFRGSSEYFREVGI